jgi:xanthine dehydrogenase small subunit
VTGISFQLNGTRIHVDNPGAHMTLLDFIRLRGLTGAKEGCAEGECGACAVAVVEPVDAGCAYRVINSCLMLLPMAADQEIYTVESLATGGELCDAQRALAAAGGSQCGYCTPGFVVSLFAEQHRPGRNGSCDTMALSGNLCRCTGYRPIHDAAKSLGAAPPTPFLDRLAEPAPGITPFALENFSRPATVDECLSILQATPGAKVIAGGTDLGVEANLRGARWPHLVSIEAIAELREFSSTPQRVTIGAALPLNEIGRRWTDAPAMFHEWLGLFASPLIRNRATLGGNLATASPIGDAAPVLLALDAVIHVAGIAGRRAIPIASFFTAYRRTAMQPGEIVVSIEIPKPLPEFLRFYKVAKRRLDDISTVAAAMAMDLDGGGRIQRSRFALGGVAATPVRILEAEDAVTAQSWNESAVARVQNIFDRTLTPLSDHRGSAEYRLEVSKSLVEKYWWEHRL